MSIETKIPVGTVLNVQGDSGYWKIMGEPIAYPDRVFIYPCKKCSKTGKEFRYTNGFNCSWIHKGLKDGTVKIITSSNVGTKADIDSGIVDGKKKRRIQYLKARIENMQKELARLENKTS